MQGHGEKQSRKQGQAILALLTCSTVGEAAKQVGVSDVTLWRWLQQEPFREQYRAARQQVLDVALMNLQHAAGEAVETLRRNLNCGTSSVEVRAALGIVDQAIKVGELQQIAQRVEAVEALLKQQAEGGRG